MTAAACRKHPHSQLTTKLQPCRPDAAAGSTMCVWQIRAVLCLVDFIGSCDRSPDHVIATYEHRTAQSLIGDKQLTTAAHTNMQRACLPPADHRTIPCRPATAGSTTHARVAGPRCPIALSFDWSLRQIARPHHRLCYRSLCLIVSYIHKTLLLLSVGFGQQTAPIKQAVQRACLPQLIPIVLTPADYPCLVPGPQQQSYSSTSTGISSIYLCHTMRTHGYVIFFISVRWWALIFSSCATPPGTSRSTCVAPPTKKKPFRRFYAQIYDWKHLYLCIFLVRHSVILP